MQSPAATRATWEAYSSARKCTLGCSVAAVSMSMIQRVQMPLETSVTHTSPDGLDEFGRLLPGQRVRRGHDEVDRVVSQVDRLQAGGERYPVVDPVVHECDVRVPAGHGLQTRLGCQLLELELKIGGRRHEGSQRRGGHPADRGGEAGDAQDPGQLVRQLLEPAARQLPGRLDRLRRLDQNQCGVGEDNAPTGRLQQPRAHLALEFAYLLTRP